MTNMTFLGSSFPRSRMSRVPLTSPVPPISGRRARRSPRLLPSLREATERSRAPSAARPTTRTQTRTPTATPPTRATSMAPTATKTRRTALRVLPSTLLSSVSLASPPSPRLSNDGYHVKFGTDPGVLLSWAIPVLLSHALSAEVTVKSPSPALPCLSFE
jgi:hypothetical protein